MKEKENYYFVESKGDVFDDILRDPEKAKIKCGHEHFKALGEEVSYMVASNYENLINQV